MATYYVNYTSGTDNYPTVAGGIMSPWKTINYAINSTNFTSTDTLYLRGGTHVTTDVITGIPSGASEGARTIIANYDDEDVVIQRSGGNLTALMYISPAGGAAKSYLTITGSAGHPIIMDGDSQRAAGGILYTTPGSGSHTYINLAYLTIRHTEDSGIITGSSNFGYAHHIICHGNGTLANQDHGLYVSGSSSDNVFEDFELYDNMARGVQNHSSSSTPNRNIYRRFNCHDNGAQGIQINKGSDVRVEYCVSWNNGSCGLHFSGGSGHIGYNNSCYGNNTDSSAAQVLVNSGVANCTLKNTISLNGVNSNWNILNGTTTQSNNVHTGTTGANIWTDPANGDFSLKNSAGTPHADVTTYIIDQGASVGLTQDHYGTSVPQGAAPDIGATEWGDTDPPDAPSLGHTSPYVVTAGVESAIALELSDDDSNTKTFTIVSTGNTALRLGVTTDCTVDVVS